MQTSQQTFLPPLGEVVERSETDGGLRIYKNYGKLTACIPPSPHFVRDFPQWGKKILLRSRRLISSPKGMKMYWDPNIQFISPKKLSVVKGIYK